VAGLFDRDFDPRSLVIARRDGRAGAAASDFVVAEDAVESFERAFAGVARTVPEVLSVTAGDLAEALRQPDFGDLAAMTSQQAAIAAAVVFSNAPKNYE